MLNIFYGRADSGKSARLFEELRIRADRGIRGMILLVPETASHNTERRLCATLGDRSSFHCEVLTFTRLTQRIFANCGGLAARIPDDGVRILLMYRAFEQTRSSLKVYTHLTRSCELLKNLLSLYDECAAGCVDAEKLGKTVPKTEGLLSDKLRDLSLLFGAYEDAVYRSLSDPRDALSRARDALAASDFLRGCTLAIDGFEGFTPVERNLLDTLIARAEDIYAAFTGGSLTPDDDSVFRKPMRTASLIARIAENHAHAVRYIRLDPPVRDPALAYLEEHFEDYTAGSFAGNCSRVRIHTAATPYAECEAAAADILTHVRGGLRWRDCAVVAPALDDYRLAVECVFERCGIPCFLSEKTDLEATGVCAVAARALDVVIDGFRTEDVLAYLKTGLLDFSPEDCDRLENYALIRKLHTIGPTPWDGHPDGLTVPFDDDARARLSYLNGLREKLRAPLEKLREGISGTSPAIDKTRALYQFLEDVGLPETCETRAQACQTRGDLTGADEYRQLWGILCGALDSMADALGERRMDGALFTSLYRLVLSQYSVGVIPSSLDRVHVGATETLQARSARCVWILGMSESAYPGGTSSGGILTGTERDTLDALGIELLITDDGQDRTKRFAMYAAVSSPDLALTLSCPRCDMEGGEISPSPFLSRVRLLLPGTRTTVDGDWALAAEGPALEHALSGTSPLAQAAYRWFSENSPYDDMLADIRRRVSRPRGPVMSEPLRKQLYGARPKLSATGVDLWFSCRYRYFITHGLRLDERRPAAFDAPEAGTFRHFVLEHTVRDVRENYGSFRNTNADYVLARGRFWMEEYANERLGGLSNKSARFIFLFTRVCRAMDALLTELYAEFSQCLFEPMDFELAFSPYEAMGAVEIPLGSGVTAVLSGKTDRVDGFLHDGKLYIRVVDYKTSQQRLSFGDLYDGVGLQLLLYLFVLEERAEAYRKLHPELPPRTPLVPAGLLYVPIGMQYRFGSAKGDSREGLVTDNAEILRAMDPEGQGFVPVTLRKDGTVKNNRRLVTPERFRILDRHVRRMLREMGSGLARGLCDASPRGGKDLCVRCPYRPVCRFDERAGDVARPAQANMKPDEFYEGIGGNSL